MSVKNTHPDYDRMIGKWKRCRDVAAGQDAMRTQCIGNAAKRGGQATVNLEAYIPALKDQTTEEYQAFVWRSPFYNATWRTIAGLEGMMFRKPPVVKVPATVEPLILDVSMSGEPIQMFAQHIAEECLKVGRIGVLVDYPAADATKPLTLADAQRLNLRPTMVTYLAESIINWRRQYVGNQYILTQVVLAETSCEAKDEFTETRKPQWRVLDLFNGAYRIRIFERDEKDDADVLIKEMTPLMNNQPLSYIPFQFIGVDDLTPDCDEPPMIDLVDMNISHWRSTADYEHGCHFAGLPTPVISGYKPAKEGEALYIGSSKAWIFPDPEAKATYLEFTGAGLEPLKANITEKEQRMAVLGARMLEAQRKAVEAAETASIHLVGEQSMLSSVAQTISLGLTTSLQWFTEWAGATPDAETGIQLNRDFFPVPMGAQTLTALISAWQSGGISFDTLFANLKAAEVIAQTRTVEEEEAAITGGGPQFTATGTGDAGTGGA